MLGQAHGQQGSEQCFDGEFHAGGALNSQLREFDKDDQEQITLEDLTARDQELFEQLAKDMGVPRAMQEAHKPSASARGSSAPPTREALIAEGSHPGEWMALWSEVETWEAEDSTLETRRLRFGTAPATQNEAASTQDRLVAKLPHTSMRVLKVPRLSHGSSLRSSLGVTEAVFPTLCCVLCVDVLMMMTMMLMVMMMMILMRMMMMMDDDDDDDDDE